MEKLKRRTYLWQFIKLNLAGNILFWGTMLGSFVFVEIFHWPHIYGLALASFISHIAFFIVDREWVFAEKGGRKKSLSEVVKFFVFMGINYFINIAIVEGLRVNFGLSIFIGQCISAVFFTIWNWIGLKFWVFRETHHHAITVKVPKGARRVRRA